MLIDASRGEIGLVVEMLTRNGVYTLETHAVIVVRGSLSRERTDNDVM